MPTYIQRQVRLTRTLHLWPLWNNLPSQTVINDWVKILDNGGRTDTFILDFEKAFDTPPHELLKRKLFGCGVGGKTLKWTDSFLCYRQQRVVVNGAKSDWAPVLSGVPHYRQGTVLGPLLFSLYMYINDISTDTDSEITYDCDCYREIKDRGHTETSERYRSIRMLSKEMGYEISTCQMQYDANNKETDQKDASYTLEGTVLENVESIKYLGVTIPNDLRWNTHISNVCTKANRTLGFLR